MRFPPCISRAPALTVALALALAPGCGGEDASSQGNGRLSDGERAAVARSLDGVYAYCRQVRDYFAGREPPPSRQAGERAERSVAELIAAAREKPQAEYALGQPLRTLVGDTAEDLEATNCSARLVELLQRGLAELPPN